MRGIDERKIGPFKCTFKVTRSCMRELKGGGESELLTVAAEEHVKAQIRDEL